IIIIPRVNACGLCANTRNVPDIISWNINRNYYQNHKMNPHLINQYIDLIDNADLIIDLHEGWGYYFMDKDSIGSGIYCESDDMNLHNVVLTIINKINNNIDNPKKYFGTKLKQQVNNTLSHYCALKHLNYIGVET